MSAATADRDTKTKGMTLWQDERAFAVDVGYVGCAAGFNAAGYMAPVTNAIGDVFHGIFTHRATNAGSAGDINAKVEMPMEALWDCSGLSQTDVGNDVYFSDDHTVTTSGTNCYAGIITELVGSTTCWVNHLPAIRAASAYAGGAITITDATTPSLTAAAGATNTGFVLVNGKTSGGIKITSVDAAGYTLTVRAAAVATADRTLTLPDPGGSDSVVYLALAGSLSGKTLVSPVISTGLTASGSAANTFVGSTGTFVTSTGANTISGHATVAAAKTLNLSGSLATVAAGTTGAHYALLNQLSLVTTAGASNVYVNLPNPAVFGTAIVVNTGGASAQTITVSGYAAETIDGASTDTIAANKAVQYFSDGTNWFSLTGA